MKRFFKAVFLAVLGFSVISCSNINENIAGVSCGENEAVIKITAAAENVSVTSERTVMPKAGSIDEFTDFTLTYASSSSSSAEKTVAGSWKKYSDLSQITLIVESGTKYFTLTAKRYGVTFSQRIYKSILPGNSYTLEFNSLSTSGSEVQTGKASVSLILPQAIAEKTFTVEVMFDGEEETVPAVYNAETKTATYTEESFKTGSSIIAFTAIDSAGNKIFVYPVTLIVKAGFLSESTIDASTGSEVKQDSSLINTVTYKINSSTSTAEDYAVKYYPGCTILSPEDCGFTVTGKKFYVWNTNANSAGTSYNAGDTPVLKSDTTLYAIWLDLTDKIITYSANYPDGTTAQKNTFVESSAVTVLTSEQANFAAKGYNFAGWNTKADGTGIDVEAASSMEVTGDTTLYAKWTPWTITFDMNGGSSRANYTAAIQNSIPGRGTIPYIYITQKYSYYAFQGWSLNKNSLTADYVEDDSIDITGDTTLYAVWKLETLVNDTSAVSVESSSYIYNATPFTFLKQETVTIKCTPSGELNFHICTDITDYTAVKNTSVWSIKNATSVNTEIQIPAGQYYFVVKNDNIFTTKTVTRTVAGK